jgi:hypothetical protein
MMPGNDDRDPEEERSVRIGIGLPNPVPTSPGG